MVVIRRGLIFVLMCCTCAWSLTAGDTLYTRLGAAPRYWIAYEHCWVNNIPMPEDRWQKNIDWVAEHFLPFGYTMISNDGWIEQAQTVNEQGYITKYNDDWKQTFEEWGSYMKSKGLQMGVYYNPMWMTKAAYDKNVKVTGTQVKSRDIVGARSFNDSLYWVDVNKPGAKEWIQNYIKYFKSIGTVYLRIDFLENYERNYGTVSYDIALNWIKEAAGDDLYLSLVMPNCYDHGATELKYGDMIRIDDDCFAGGWDFFSNRRRGQWNPIWPQYGNAFDGFIKFSDIGGRGHMKLDGDFIRLNTMANDAERISMLSLFVLAGSPLTIADQYDTANGTEWLFQNREILDIHDAGMVGKPISNDDKDVYNSSRWVGQLPDATWVIGLFNRENNHQIRSIDFFRDLGIISEDFITLRDVWAHKTLPAVRKGYSVELQPHASQVLTFKPVKKRYQSEVATYKHGAVKKQTNFGYDGFGYVDLRPKSQLLFAVESAKSGLQKMTIRYSHQNTSDVTVKWSDYHNTFTKQMTLKPTAKTNEWSEATIDIVLKKGNNYITLSGIDQPVDIDWIQLND